MTLRRSKLYGFGRAVWVVCAQCRPEKIRHIAAFTKDHPHTMLARGAGKSYGDAALNTDGVVQMQRLNRVLVFNKTTGEFTAEAGISLADILAICVPEGWMLPVIPGTRFVTLGGAVAANVHGKNAWREGEFGQHVKRLILRVADGEKRICSASENVDIFYATMAGYGLTGIIEEVTIQLRPIQSASIQTATRRVENLAVMLEAFADAKDQADYMVGWIDHFGKDEFLGRGVFSAGRHVSGEQDDTSLRAFSWPTTSRRVPLTMPSFLLNKYSMALYNRWRFRKFSEENTRQLESFESFFHPLDNITDWWKLYGKRGFLQYQFLIPESPQMADHLHLILEKIQEAGLFSYLAVIKYHGEGAGKLGFSAPGFSIALDFPNRKKVREFLSELSSEIIAMDGHIYLAKDQLLTAPQAADMFKERLGIWQKIAERADPDYRFQSTMSKRLMLRLDKQGKLNPGGAW